MPGGLEIRNILIIEFQSVNITYMQFYIYMSSGEIIACFLLLYVYLTPPLFLLISWEIYIHTTVVYLRCIYKSIFYA